MAIDLNYKILGEGEVPIIILHGLFGMLDNWMSFANKLKDKYKVILVDHRNHGKSPHTENIGFDYYSNDLNHLLNHLNIEKAHLLGHSMGGKTVMNFALKFPQLTQSVTAVDIGAHGYYTGNHDEIFDAILPLILSNYNRRSEIDDVLAENIDDHTTRQFLLKNLSRGENGFGWKANFSVLYEQYDELRKSIESANPYDGKALFVRGGHSRYVRDEDFPYIKKLFPSAELVTIEGAGHWVHAEKPKELLDTLKAFLE